MKNKFLLSITIFLAMLSLTACQNNKKQVVTKQSGAAKVHQNSANQTSKTDFGHKTKFGAKDSDNVWDSDKQAKLDNFFDKWATTMDQEYEKYQGSGQITTAAGEKFPQDFNRATLNGSKVSLAYNPNGKGNAEYNVVAIYNYDKNEAASHITYFFAFHNGQPIVLVDETTNGDVVQLKQTANKDLINGFNEIASGNTATMSNSNAGATEPTDPKLIGTFVGLLENGDWFKSQLAAGYMYYGSNWDVEGQVKGYDYITANGDPTSYFWFKQNGSDITVKYVRPVGNQTVAEAGMKTEHFTLDRLKSDYYVSNSQKQEVNGYVAKIKPVAEEDY